jgi:hypothetical protein
MKTPATLSGVGADIDDANHVADASAALKSHDNFYRAILDAVFSYIRQGFAIVPVPYRQKGPIIERWQNLRITADDAPRYFNGGPQNIGVIQGHASGGLTDIDLDCQEAIAAAPYLLPKTSAFGHASKRASHWIYKTNLAETQDRAAIKFMGAGKSGLLEVRTGGGGFAAQTIFPPSTHISGELIKWEDGNDEILETDGAELLACANQLAAAAQLAIAYPKIGGRHDAAFVLGGFLPVQSHFRKAARARSSERWETSPNKITRALLLVCQTCDGQEGFTALRSGVRKELRNITTVGLELGTAAVCLDYPAFVLRLTVTQGGFFERSRLE